jgi:GTP-binding protein LepA
MEIVQERLEREFNQTVITTVPNVSFIAYTTRDEKIIVNNPTEMPDPVKIKRIEEPFIRAQIITTPDYIGNIITLCLGKTLYVFAKHYVEHSKKHKDTKT